MEDMNNLKLNIKTVEGETLTIDIVKDDSNWDLKVNVLKRSKSKSRFINKLIFDGECEDNSIVFIDPNENDKTHSPFPKLSEPSEEITTFTYKIPRMTSEPTTSQAAAKLKEHYSIVAIKEPPKANYAANGGSSFDSSEEDIRYFFKDFAQGIRKDNKEEENSNTSIKLLMRPKDLTYGFTHSPTQLNINKEIERNKMTIERKCYGHTPLMVYDVNVEDPLEALRTNKFFIKMLPEMKRTPEIIGAVLRKICNECPPMLSIIRDNEKAVLAMLIDDLIPLVEKHSE
ncbi:uncharacterized protein LOC119662637 [Teleopsis dalmanni]|uniref:uncharacterized protein LOC119662637 n=1 Tax=Teleopsis dalmanni TaxID=139649 RepID=UPI0018CF903E|nr:uncharacterized protein LOC119662637 [Teleopsis dalmanni]XP_037928226.1 uncharacterized protein LOC119662637 [Teleopsis dalmanni]XP_037928227.1 uncharacterized protein LOC119662637 [Teleopsis dalmanni]